MRRMIRLFAVEAMVLVASSAHAAQFSGVWQCQAATNDFKACYRGKCDLQVPTASSIQIDWKNKKMATFGSPWSKFSVLQKSPNILDLFAIEKNTQIPLYVRASEDPAGNRFVFAYSGSEGNEGSLWSYLYSKC